jgi:hypothetical protein
VCNLEWYTWQLECRIRLCNRRCAVYCLAGILRPNTVTLQIRRFLLSSAARLEKEKKWEHRFHLLQLSWLVCPMFWWIESDSAAEEERYISPVLRTLNEVHIIPSSSAFRLVPFKCVWGGCTALDLVCTYLYDISYPTPLRLRDTTKLPRSILRHPEASPKLAAGARQCDWWMFTHENQRWLWRESSQEWFYMQSPPSYWCRYRFRWHCDQFYWWHNDDDSEWFFEPVPGAHYRR